MAGELQTDYLTGKTIYFLLRSSVGTIWNGTSLTSYLSANYSQYPIAATEQGSSGYYVAAMPAVAAGIYNVLAKLQAGASPAETDITVGTGQIDWSGSVVETLSFFPISGTAQPAASGVFTFASLNSGQSVLVYSGQLSGQPVNPLSGVTVPQSGLTFIASGPFVNVPIASISGVRPISGTSVIASLYSGQNTIPYSGQLSGQLVNPASGVTWLSSGGNNAIWQVIVSPQGGGKTAGFCLKQLYQTNLAAADAVCFDTGASQNAFNTSLTDASGMWNDALLVFTAGSLAGESRIIATYVTTNGRVTFDENWTVAPSSGDTFNVKVGHTHTASQIADFVWNESLSGHRISGTAGQYLDNLQVSGIQLLSGQTTSPYSGSLSGQPVSPLSGVTQIASGPFVVANISGQSTIAASGLYVTVPKETLSGIVPASGAYTFASLNSGTLSGQPMDKAVLSGLSAIAILYSGSLSGQKVELFSGNIVAELSGAYVIASLLSGQQVSIYSGQLSGQPVSPNSGAYGVVPMSTLSGIYANASLLSGNSVLLYSGMLSGQPMSVAFNQDKSGYSLAPAGLDTITVESGMNFRQAQAIIAAGNGGQLSGVGTGTIRIGAANVSGGPIRITGTVTSGGNRTAVVLNLPS